MNYLKVISADQFKELLSKGRREFVTCKGCLRHSYYFDLDDDIVYVLDYCDDSEYNCTLEELVEEYYDDIVKGWLFCEIDSNEQ